MSTLEALLLGIVQGLTEFLPVSSSGHLTLSQHLLGLQNLKNYILFDLICHLGTLLAILIVFRNDIRHVLRKNRTRLIQIALGTLPLFPLLLILKPIKSLFDRVDLLGFFFLTTALILYMGIRFGRNKGKKALEASCFTDPIWIGIFQALAIIPGISRSGATISGARLAGWSKQDAVTFSFLLAIPAILGGSVVEAAALLKQPSIAKMEWPQYAAGFFSSFLFGYGALKVLITLAIKEKLIYFVWYCLLLGLASLIYFN